MTTAAGDAGDLVLRERLIGAEQDERRRIAVFLHDGPVQSLAGIALMLDAALAAVREGRADEADRVLSSALDRHRATIRALRDLSFDLEPVILRDQGFVPAVMALAEQLGLTHGVRIDLELDAADELSEKAQIALSRSCARRSSTPVAAGRRPGWVWRSRSRASRTMSARAPATWS